MRLRASIACLALLAVITSPLGEQTPDPGLALFFQAASPDKDTSEDALEQIGEQWKNGYTALLLDWVRFLPSGKAGDTARLGADGNAVLDTDFSGGDPSGNSDPLRGGSRFGSRRDPRVQTRERILKFLERQTGQKHGDDLDAWRQWMWAQPYDTHAQIGVFKANLYGSVDQTFRSFFQGTAAVRLDEIDWGGVRVGAAGIPALDQPPTIAADEASYLADDNIVFGLVVDGAARAYPKRILAWHELARDNVGGLDITLVYCTLCGAVIPYKSEVGGRVVKFDTSGLLFRSNKLLFDELSWTLWSSITGEPLVGRMVGSGVRLSPLPVVTTTWSDWRATHPDTTVLALDTGFERDYSENVAYADYFATDELMFTVSHRDSRLGNKDEVLALRFRGRDGDQALAISAAFLQKNRLFQANFAGRSLVVVTSEDGANRLYASPPERFVRFVGANRIEDEHGGLWEARAHQLVPLASPEAALPRLNAFRAFWFGWYAQYPETELIAG